MSAPELEYPHLVEELRLAGPPPSEELRARVRALGEVRVREPRRWPRFVAIAMPIAAVGAAFAIGGLEAAREGGGDTVAGEAALSARPLEYTSSAGQAAPTDLDESYNREAVAQKAVGSFAGGAARAPLAPNRTRAQEYEADMVVHVDGLLALSRATTSAMQQTRDMGGYLVSATQDSSADGRGYSSLVVRVPTHKVQRAIVRFAQLGVILDQNVEVRDLQAQLDQLFAAAQATRRLITELEALLARATGDERAQIERQLKAQERRLDELTGRRTVVQRRASFARVGLTLTTEETAAIAPVPEEPGRIERAWERSLDILVDEAVVVLYVILVGGPFIVLGALAWLAARSGRRRGREALLERS